MGRLKKGQKKPKNEPRTIGVRATGEWAEWLDELARYYRTTVAGVIDRALAEWTESQNYPKKPPQRMP